MLASAASDLPSEGILRETLGSHRGVESSEGTNGEKIRVLVLCWDCGDATHPASSARWFERNVPHARVEIAQTREEVETWNETIRDFVKSV
jgi:hypothetical protein